MYVVWCVVGFECLVIAWVWICCVCFLVYLLIGWLVVCGSRLCLFCLDEIGFLLFCVVWLDSFDLRLILVITRLLCWILLGWVFDCLFGLYLIWVVVGSLCFLLVVLLVCWFDWFGVEIGFAVWVGWVFVWVLFYVVNVY